MKTTSNITRADWNDLRYPTLVQRASDEQGGCFYAWIPLLGRGLFMADGETAAEALDILEELRLENYELVVESGRPIPLPEDEETAIFQPSSVTRETVAV